MAVYSYEARSFQGQKVQGTLQADSESHARIQLRAKKLIPIKVYAGGSEPLTSKSKGWKLGGSVRIKDLQIFTRQLSVLVGSGVPILESIELLSRSPRGPVLDEALAQIYKDVSEGKKLEVSFRKHPKVFDSFYVSMLMAGEEGGVLEKVLRTLSEHMEKAVKLRSKIKGAMAYPVAVLVISLCVTLGLLLFVVPNFVKIFQSSGKELPQLTQIVVSLSELVSQNWMFFLCGAGVVFFLIRSYLQTSVGQEKKDAFVLRIPVFGNFMVKASMASFSRTLSTLLEAGVPILKSLDISAATARNAKIEKIFLSSKVAVSKGQSLSSSLPQESFIPQMVVQMISVGEQTGALGELLGRVADFYEDEVEVAVSSIISLMEPVMIVFLAGIVGFFSYCHVFTPIQYVFHGGGLNCCLYQLHFDWISVNRLST